MGTDTPPRADIIDLFDSLVDLDPLQRRFLKERYGALYCDFRRRSRRYSVLFYCLRIIITVGSLLVPALLSIQYTNSSFNDPRQAYELTIYWITWFLSLGVTTSNGVYTLFKVDKKYYYLITAFELLKSEAWQYLELTGRYATKVNGPRATHQNQFLYFSHALEKHKLKQVEEEYYKFYDHGSGGGGVQEGGGNSGAGGGAGGTLSVRQIGDMHQHPHHDTLSPPTPDKSLIEISKTISPETLRTVNNILTSLGKTATPDVVISHIQAAARRASINGGANSPLGKIVEDEFQVA